MTRPGAASGPAGTNTRSSVPDAGAKPWQLFDLEADPFEQTNLVADPASAGTAAELHRRLIDLLDASEDDYALAPAFGIAGRRVVAR